MHAAADPTPVDRPALSELAALTARRIGEHIRLRREDGVDVAATKSSPSDVVTAADREAERLIGEALLSARPDDGLLGEEGASTPGTSGITWVVDPIDGTVNYLYNLPGYAVSIAATVQDPHAFADGRRAIAGAVYSPVTDELFEAWSGGGARRNGAPIGVSRAPDVASCLVGTGFGYTAERRAEQAEVLRQLLPRVRDIRRLGAASYDLCQVAAGGLDAYYERGLQPWDYAAGALIASEAGATLLGSGPGHPPGEPLLIAAAPGRARELQEALRVSAPRADR